MEKRFKLKNNKWIISLVIIVGFFSVCWFNFGFSLEDPIGVKDLTSNENLSGNSNSALINENSSLQSLYTYSSPVFDDSILHEIELTFGNQNWYDELYQAHQNDLDDPYFEASFSFDGFRLDPIGINFKGHSSFNNGEYGSKKSFRIDFNEYEDYSLYGLQKLNLNNGFSDPTFMREKLFLDAAKEYIPVIRCSYARVNINGEYYGLYTVVEHIDDVFVESRFGSNEQGNLYRAESQCSLNYLGSDQSEYNRYYELKTNEDINDYSDLINFLKSFDSDEYIPEEILDVESTLYALAFLNIYSSLDSYLGSAHNFYLYNREDKGEFIYLLWDANMAFGTFTMGLGEDENIIELDPFWVPENDIILPEDQIDAQPPDGRPDRPPIGDNHTYLQMMAQILREEFNLEIINSRISKYDNLIEDAFQADPNKLFTYEQYKQNLDIDLSVNKMKIYGIQNFVEERSNYLSDFLDQFVKETDLQFNEVMIQNKGLFPDELNQFEPWIEIKNLGPGKLQLGSYYLTNNQDNPLNWKFPEIQLEDGEYFTVWLDNSSNEGHLHVNFTIEEHDSLFLYYQNINNSKDIVLVDQIIIPALSANYSYGRDEDEWLNEKWIEYSQNPTLNEKNILDTVILEHPEKLIINEIMAENSYYIENPSKTDEYSDWFEIYNAGNESINLSGLYLTDDSYDPILWEFPENTILESENFLVVWADRTMEISKWQVKDTTTETSSISYHSNFKLSGEGETLYIVDRDGQTIISSFNFPAAITDFSFGLITLENGSIIYDYMSIPTPGAINRFSSNEIEELEIFQLQVSLGIFLLGLVVIVGMGTFYQSYQRKQHNSLVLPMSS